MSRGADVGRVAVVGAGIAGLAAAHRLHRLRPDLDVVVLEASARIGGKVLTTEFAGLPVDEAADAFLARSDAAVGLCRELGLDDRFVTPASRSAFVWRAGALARLPEGTVLGVPTDLDAVRASGLVSDAGLARAAADLDRRVDEGAPGPGEDESVGALVRRRLGDEVFEALVAPLLAGVNAGDADRLSLAAGAAQLAAAAAADASLIAGVRSLRDAARTAAGGADAPVFYGLRGGTQVLTDALAATLAPGAVRTGHAVERVRATGSRARLTVRAGASAATDDLDVDGLVIATPTFVTASLLDGAVDAATVRGLRDLDWASPVMVTLAARRDAVDHPLDGSGFLVADHDDLLLTACSFGSSKWAHWSQGDVVILRASAGRVGDERALSMTPAELVGRLTADLQRTIGLRGEPDAARVSPWPRGLPQYLPGHLQRSAAWRAAVRDALGPVELAGAGYEGLGLPACIVSGEDAARAVIERLG